MLYRRYRWIADRSFYDTKGQDFKRVGLSTLTDILNVVAPPISEHEVIQVWLSHDMKGHEGVETIVYRALARVSFSKNRRETSLIFNGHGIADIGASRRWRFDCQSRR